MKIHNFINNLRWKIFLVILLVLALAFFVNESRIKKPIIIGFSAQLTGKQAELGIQERNGVQLAVEKINSSGGIHGRKIRLIIRDDFGLREKAKEADRELIESGAVAIIGHATTAQTLAGLEVTKPKKVIMISPTVSTPELSGIDDYFFRVYPGNSESGKAYAQYIYEKSGITDIAIIYDSDNEAYAKSYSSIFSEKFQSLGGKITSEIKFSSLMQPDFTEVVSKLHDSEAKGVLIIASDIDTALIAQKIRYMEWQAPLFSSAWAETQTLIDNGGKTVEGMKLERAYVINSESQSFIDFKTRYKGRFGQDPAFGAGFSYEATLVLSAALEKTGGRSEGLHDALIGLKDFHGIINKFSFDKYGDVQRPFYLGTISNGEVVTIDQMTKN